MGKFVKGQSGNPGGRPGVPKHVRELARSHTEEAIETWVEVMRDKSAPPAARVSAANSVVERGWGKAAQPVTGEDGEGPAELIHRIELVAAKHVRSPD